MHELAIVEVSSARMITCNMQAADVDYESTTAGLKHALAPTIIIRLHLAARDRTEV
jgi:hypothetical protein